MHTSQHFTQLQSIFGSGYVPEQHADETHQYLPPLEHREFVVNFDDLLKRLRAALSLR